jgi:hypothetical protein
MLAGPAEWGIDPKRGEIRYRARLAQPLRVIDLRVLSVVWRALRPADEVPIGLLSDEAHSGAYLGATLLSENEFGPAGALAGTIARISLDRSDAADGGRSVRDPFDSLRSAAGAAVDRRPIALWIDYESKPIYQPGEWVVFDVYLENPDLASFDDLRLALRFDPRDLVFADTDLRNLVHRGVNALDAPFRSNWGWHTTVANEIDNARGRIDYRVRGSAMSPKKSGVLVRAIAQVKRIAAEPLLTWTDDGREAVGAYLLGANLLGELDGRRVAAGPTVGPRGEVFSIRPGVFGERADPALYRDRPSGAFEAFYPELYRLIRK